MLLKPNCSSLKLYFNALINQIQSRMNKLFLVTHRDHLCVVEFPSVLCTLALLRVLYLDQLVALLCEYRLWGRQAISLGCDTLIHTCYISKRF